jgi:hypothetical protein
MNKDVNKQNHTNKQKRKTKQGNGNNIKNSVCTIAPAILLLEKINVYTHSY